MLVIHWETMYQCMIEGSTISTDHFLIFFDFVRGLQGPWHPIAKGVVKCFWAFGLSGKPLVKQGNGLQENPPFSAMITI